MATALLNQQRQTEGVVAVVFKWTYAHVFLV